MTEREEVLRDLTGLIGPEHATLAVGYLINVAGLLYEDDEGWYEDDD